jgi:hypothetical protein
MVSTILPGPLAHDPAASRQEIAAQRTAARAMIAALAGPDAAARGPAAAAVAGYFLAMEKLRRADAPAHGDAAALCETAQAQAVMQRLQAMLGRLDARQLQATPRSA